MSTQDTLAKLKAAYGAQDWQTAKTVLPVLKIALADGSTGLSQEQTFLLTREVLELAVHLSVQMRDEAAFERNYLPLRAHYTDTRGVLPASQNEPLVTGLNLLRLLVQNRIAEFHTELEVIPAEAQQQPAVAFVIQLEQWLMEGAYNKVLAARDTAPSDLYRYFLDLLATTVRDEVAGCSERAYASLKMDDAQQLLMIRGDSDTSSFAKERGWDLKEGRVFFQPQQQVNDAQVDAVEVIGNSMTYAHELERIV